jgi:uncharacterized repeat protein (TIGR03803 family)
MAQTPFGGAHFIGTVYELIAPSGPNPVLATLYSFRPGDGSPVSCPVFDNAGRLYGTTWSGGANNLGTIFELPPVVGAQLMPIHAFSGVDGASPGQLLLQETGTGPIILYGAAWGGGAASLGTVFKVVVP